MLFKQPIVRRKLKIVILKNKIDKLAFKNRIGCSLFQQLNVLLWKLYCWNKYLILSKGLWKLQICCSTLTNLWFKQTACLWRTSCRFYNAIVQSWTYCLWVGNCALLSFILTAFVCLYNKQFFWVVRTTHNTLQT